MLTTSKITMNEEKIRKSVFKEQESAAEGRVIVTILDLPRLHDFNEATADEFFVTLAEEAEIELFANKSMQIIIDFKFPYIRKWILLRLFLPFVLFLVLYVASNSYVELEFIADPLNDSLRLTNLILAVTLLVISLYFLAIEFF